MNCNYPDPKSRSLEWEKDVAKDYADKDSARPAKEFLREIYAEANNSQQDPDARIAKV